MAQLVCKNAPISGLRTGTEKYNKWVSYCVWTQIGKFSNLPAAPKLALRFTSLQNYATDYLTDRFAREHQ